MTAPRILTPEAGEHTDQPISDAGMLVTSAESILALAEILLMSRDSTSGMEITGDEIEHLIFSINLARKTLSQATDLLDGLPEPEVSP